MSKSGFGERLKRERELRGVSRDEVCTATRIGSRYLDALENEQWGTLPGGVFNRCFVRAVARFLGLDEDEIDRVAAKNVQRLVTVRSQMYLEAEARKRKLQHLANAGMIVDYQDCGVGRTGLASDYQRTVRFQTVCFRLENDRHRVSGCRGADA